MSNRASKSRQIFEYIEADMQERFSLRLSKVQREWVRELAEMMQLDETNTVRAGITLLAQWYGIAKGPSPTANLVARMERVLALLEAYAREKGIDLDSRPTRRENGF